jgi:hypothetical protein
MSAPRPTASAARGVTIGGFSGRRIIRPFEDLREKDEKKKDDDEDEKRKHEPRR